MRSPPVGTIYLLKRAELAVRSCMEVALAEFGLTPAQFLMLYRLRDTTEPSGADIAREIGVRPQSIFQIVRPLEQKGLLKREPRPGHRTILHTRLTPAGRELVDNALRVAGRFEAEVLARVGRDQLLGLQETLGQLLASAEKHELHPNSTRARASTPLIAQGARHRAPFIKRVRPG